jgi:hypothetical protein
MIHIRQQVLDEVRDEMDRSDEHCARGFTPTFQEYIADIERRFATILRGDES